MMSKGWFSGALAAVAVLGLGACRPGPVGPDVVTGPDAGTDVQNRPDMGMVGDDVQNPMDVQGDSPTVSEVTIRNLQDPNDPAHPAPGTNVTLRQTGMVALTARVLIGSAMGDSTGRCRWAVWVSDGTGGDYSAIQVQELTNRGDAGNCFSTTPRNIPDTVQPGSQISLVENSDYGEFCSGPTGIDQTMCREYQQGQLFAPRMFTVSGMGSAPTPIATTIAEIGQMGDTTNVGPRTLALEGTLVAITGATITREMRDGSTFPDYYLTDSAGTRTVGIQVSNFPRTGCVRDYLAANVGSTVATAVGILVPDFGRWRIRLRSEADLGVNCMMDGGTTPTDAGGD